MMSFRPRPEAAGRSTARQGNFACHAPARYDERAGSEPYLGYERMIVQACMNGARDVDFHPALPLTVEAMARDGASCVAAGAAELHLHPRGPDRRESLGPPARNST